MKRRGYFFTFLILLGGVLIFRNVFAANTDIVINEIGAYPSVSTHRWIEIWNKGDGSVDLNGWKFLDANAQVNGHELRVTTTDSVVDRGEYAVIVKGAKQFLTDYPAFGGSIFEFSSGSLNPEGENIGLIDAEGIQIERFTYIPTTHFSLQRKDPNLIDYTSANWVEHASGNTVGGINVFDIAPTPIVTSTPTTTPDPTPIPNQTQNTGQNNSGSQNQNSTPVPVVQNLTALKINEFVVDPESGNEWVELYNNSTASVDITDAMICDARNTTSTCKKIMGSVGGNGWLQVDLQTKSFLNNSGDSVILKNSSGSIIDRIDYDDELTPDEGQSLARKIDGKDTDNDIDWIVTDTITPGKANIVSEPEDEAGQSGGSSTSTTSSTTKTTKTTKNPASIFVWDIEAPSSAAPNEQVVFNAENTADPRGGSLSFVWSLENGIKVVGPELKVSFASSGMHTLLLFVTSTSGYGEEKKIEIEVDNGLSLNAEIVISEVLPNPEGDDTKEFIELKNNSALAVNIAGWFLRVQAKKYIFPENTFIPADGFLVFYKTATKISLANTTGKVELLNKDKALVDIVKYDKPEAGKSLSLINNEWRWADPTPGKVYVKGEVLGIKIGAEQTVKKVSSKKAVGPLIKNIADIRQGEKGQPVKVRGIVAVLPNVFGSQFFYIVGDGGGIEIYQNKKDFPPVGIGDSVEITGTISEASGIKRVNVKNSRAIDILATGKNPESIMLDLDNIEEVMAGSLVEVSGEITEIKSSFMFVDNGVDEIKVYFKKNTKIDKQKFKEGENVRVVGILEKVKEEWQLWPRSSDDIESLGMAQDATLQKQTTTGSEGVTEKYLTATAGGITTLILGFLARARGAMFFGGIKKVVEKVGKFIKRG